MPTGRPTNYRPELDEQIVAKMGEGLSLTAAAAELDVHRDTIYEWEKRWPSFSDAVKMGRAKRQAFLERRLFAATASPAVTSSIFALKNANPDDWRDRHEVEHSGNFTVVVNKPDAAVREVVLIDPDEARS